MIATTMLPGTAPGPGLPGERLGIPPRPKPQYGNESPPRRRGGPPGKTYFICSINYRIANSFNAYRSRTGLQLRWAARQSSRWRRWRRRRRQEVQLDLNLSLPMVLLHLTICETQNLKLLGFSRPRSQRARVSVAENFYPS